MPGNLTFDVYRCQVPAPTPGDPWLVHFTWEAVRRGPFDPKSPPEHAWLFIGTYLGASESEAIADAKADRKAQHRPVPRERKAP